MARLVYFDEAGTGTKRDEPITMVAAVIARIDEQMPNINASVRNLQSSLQVYRPKEFKADKMFSHFRKFGEDSRYAPIMRGLLGIMRDNNVTICHCAVHRANFALAEQSGLITAKRFAFIACAIFIAAWLREHAAHEGALCVADLSPDDKIVDAVIRELRNQGIPEQKIASFDQFVDTLFIVSSKKSVGLQMSDYANFFLKRHHIGDELAEPFYRTIAPLVVDSSLPVLFGQVRT